MHIIDIQRTRKLRGIEIIDIQLCFVLTLANNRMMLSSEEKSPDIWFDASKWFGLSPNSLNTNVLRHSCIRDSVMVSKKIMQWPYNLSFSFCSGKSSPLQIAMVLAFIWLSRFLPWWYGNIKDFLQVSWRLRNSIY